jgi:hypothetical protein
MSKSSSATDAVPDSAHSVYAVAAVLLALRSTLFLTGLPEWLKDDQQLTSPLTSFKRRVYRWPPMLKNLCNLKLILLLVREGVFLFKKGFDPYAGGVFRQVNRGCQFAARIPLTFPRSLRYYLLSSAPYCLSTHWAQPRCGHCATEYLSGVWCSCFDCGQKWSMLARRF